MGLGEGVDTSTIELTYNYGISDYDLGNGYGHIAIEVEDCHKTIEEIRTRGGNIAYEPTPLAELDEIIAFVTDPDGYRIELVQMSAGTAL